MPEAFGEMASFVSSVRAQLLNLSPAQVKNSTPEMLATPGWMISEGDCLASLRALSLGEPARLQSMERPPLDSFLEDFKESRTDPERRFSLLAARYRWPTNFAHDAESVVRERVLTILMVHDRAQLEKNPAAALESPDLWLRLNLIAVAAARVPDLRFLDALNYYYELLPVEGQRQTQHGWLQISYVALYARALWKWI